MAAVAAGDQDAFQHLVAGEAPRLLRLATALLGSVAEAEEITQETFVRLWQRAPDWQPVARIGTWLHQVAYRLAVDRLRRRRPVVALDDVAELLADPGPAPDEAVAAGQRARDMTRAIAALPDRQRAAVLLAHFQGLSQAEAAEVMRITEEAYESLLARARRSLRRGMAAWAADGAAARAARGLKP